MVIRDGQDQSDRLLRSLQFSLILIILNSIFTEIFTPLLCLRYRVNRLENHGNHFKYANLKSMGHNQEGDRQKQN